MGGCRCTYRNCSSRTDGKTHMFHYPVFDKVRCHQWLTNAHKLEFLNLKVSQLKNRVVCQHHFKDDNFMNFKKDKLTFDAVPTEDGPYCDTSQFDETKTQQDESKVFSISLDEIENEYLTMIDKKANFSVKYGDFLTNCDVMDLDLLNSVNKVNESNQTTAKGLCELAENLTVAKDLIPAKKSLKKVQPLKTRGKHTNIKGTLTINNAKSTVDIGKLIRKPQIEQDKNTLNLVLNVSQVPIEFEGRKPNDTIHENHYQTIDVQELDESRLLNDQSFEVKVLDEPKLINEEPLKIKVIDEPKLINEEPLKVKVIDEPKLINVQPFDVQVFDEPKLINEQPFDVQLFDEPNLVNDKAVEVKVFDEPAKYNANKSSIKENKKITILSEKRISEPLPLFGKLETVSPTRILSFPNKKIIKPTPIIRKSENSFITTYTCKDNMIFETPKIEPMNIISSGTDVSPQEIRNDAINIIPNEVLDSKNNSQKTISDEKNKTPKKVLPKTSLLRNKLPPERVAAIAEKRKFNLKLRDIVEECLEKLDVPNKTDNFDNRKILPKSKIMPNKKQDVGSYLAKHPDLPDVQDYTIAYIDARLKTIEDNLRNEIGGCSREITKLKEIVAPTPRLKNKTVHTQTSVSEDVYKRQLYQETSKYLSPETKSKLYEELFINKYTKDVTKDSSSPKRRKRR